MAKQRGRKRGIHTAVVLEPEVLERLKASEAGVSVEIRRRIRHTLDEEQFALPSRELANAVMRMADEISRQTGTPWHATAKGRQAIVAAVQQLLDAVPLTAEEDIFGPDDPSTLGRAVARSYLTNPFTMIPAPGHLFYEGATIPREES